MADITAMNFDRLWAELEKAIKDTVGCWDELHEGFVMPYPPEWIRYWTTIRLQELFAHMLLLTSSSFCTTKELLKDKDSFDADTLVRVIRAPAVNVASSPAKDMVQDWFQSRPQLSL